MGPDFRLRQGCDGIGSQVVAMLPDGTHLFECPGRAVTAATLRACTLYPLWAEGRSIGAPLALDESATLVAAMRVIGSEVCAYQNEAMTRGN